jgi:hypothetical protein
LGTDNNARGRERDLSIECLSSFAVITPLEECTFMDQNIFHICYQRTRAKCENEALASQFPQSQSVDHSEQKELESFETGWNAYQKHEQKIEFESEAKEIARELCKNETSFSFGYFIDGFVEAFTVDPSRKC